MDVFTFTKEFSSPVPAKKLFNSLILDYDNLIPKLLAQVIKSVETIQGNGGPGTIKKTTIITAGNEIKYLKHRTDALDKEKMIYSYTLIEGDELVDRIEAINYEIKFQETPDGGCIGTKVTKYYVKAGTKIVEEDTKPGKEKAMAVFKAVEAYLLANPTAYAL